MSMLRICSTDGCQVKTLGEHCLQHETAAVAFGVPVATVPASRVATLAVGEREQVTAGVA